MPAKAPPTSGIRKHRTRRLRREEYDTLAEIIARELTKMIGSRRHRHVCWSANPPNEERLVPGGALAVVALLLTTLSLCNQSSGQSPAADNCKPVSDRTTDVGCWIMAHQPVGQLTRDPFWHLDVYPTRAAAEAAKGPRGTVVESLGKVWLLTIEKAGWRAAKGEHVAEIGPLPIVPEEEYTAQYMEAIFNPGMTSSIHTHAGPEAWYTVAGETCLETPEGKLVGRAGGEAVIVPGGRRCSLPPRAPNSVVP
jgi:quercetin dioxygenase-like cupin family protein